MSDRINMDNQNMFGLQHPPKFGTSATGKIMYTTMVKTFIGRHNSEKWPC